MRPLWEPSKERIEKSNMTRFINYVNQKHSLNLDGYHPLYDWSINKREEFWAAIWEFGEVISSKRWDKVLEDSPSMIGAKWFIGARFNFAENLLRFRDDRLAIVFKGEGQPTVRMTFAQLYDEVARLAKSLRDMGVVKGDRVAGYLPNLPEAIVAMLATTSIGAIWSSCSPDFGIKGVLDRFGQIAPKALFTADG
ncbi:MAG TPA: AMP-binding protein, partial [Desulfomonilaceae bacterium]|nr:AMP-binding protein [Desulfomonilaceae bacterium]